MLQSPSAIKVAINHLNGRQRMVVTLATEGNTDAQIAHLLEISLSSVNTYWVRIREKVGPLTRTEIVAHCLRQEHEALCAALHKENRRLQDEQRSARAAQARAERILLDSIARPWSTLALEHLDIAVLVMRRTGIIAYANPPAHDLLRVEEGHLEGMLSWDLTLPEKRSAWEDAHNSFFQRRAPHRMVGGVEEPRYVVRGDGSQLRVIIAAGRFDSLPEEMAVVVLREHPGGHETFVRTGIGPLTML